MNKKDFLKGLVKLMYERTDTDIGSGKFRAKGDTIELVEGYGQYIYRIELFGDEIDKISQRKLVTNEKLMDLEDLTIFPANPFVIQEESRMNAIESIETELEQHLPTLEPLLAHRLKQRTEYDLEIF